MRYFVSLKQTVAQTGKQVEDEENNTDLSAQKSGAKLEKLIGVRPE